MAEKRPRKPRAGKPTDKGETVPAAIHATQAQEDAFRARITAERIRRQEAEMARARRVGTGGTMLVAEQHRGTGAQRSSGRLEVVDATDAGENANPHGLVRRAQVKDPIRRAVRKGQLRYRCFLAADKFRDDMELADGAGSIGSQIRPRITNDRGAPGDRYGYTGAIAAKESVRRAWQAIGLRLSSIVAWCVVPKPEGDGGPRYGTVRGYEECNRLKHGKGGEMLRDALEKLADHYGLDDPPTPKDFA